MLPDWNGDGGVSIFDFSAFSYWFGQLLLDAPSYVDLNLDGGVSIFDCADFSVNFGTFIVDPISVAARGVVVDPRSPESERKQQDDRESKQLEVPLELQLPSEELVRDDRRDEDRLWMQRSSTKTELVDLEDILDDIGLDVLEAWGPKR